MKTIIPIAALLLTWLIATAAPERAPAQGVPEDETGTSSGPVTRRAPPRVQLPSAPVPDAPETARAPDDREPAGEIAGDSPILEVLDAAVLEGVLVPYTVRDAREIPHSLTGAAGDPVSGRRLFHNFSRTGCSLCHGTAEAPRRPESDRTAPTLHRIGDRLSPARLRLWIVAPATLRPNTTMPAFHVPGQRTDPADPLYGGPLLTAAEVEDIVAYLARAGMAEIQD